MSGTFWQATQPVSGTFWQATQPVSGSVTVTPSALSANAPTNASVGTSSAQVLASNASRKGALLINLSANTISFGLGATAVLNQGITLVPYGAWSMDQASLTTGAINAIASVGSSTLAIQEFQ